MYVNGGSVIAIGVLFPIMGTTVVLARFFTKLRHQKGLWVDDWLCVPALAIVIVTGALMIYGSVAGAIGYHSPDYPNVYATMAANTPQQHILLKLEMIINILSSPGTGLIRLSFLFFYRRIFRGKSFNIISWAMIGITIAWTIAFTVGYLCACGSDLGHAFWSLAEMDAKCDKGLLFMGLHAITGFVLDICVLFLPFFWIWRLQMPMSQKWAVTSVFLCGTLTVIVGAIRIAAGIQTIIYKWGYPGDVAGYTSTDDLTGDVSIILFWSYLEQGMGLIVCCLPSLRPLVASKSLIAWIRSANAKSFVLLLYSSSQQPESREESLLEQCKPTRQIVVTKTVDLASIPAEYGGRTARWCSTV